MIMNKSQEKILGILEKSAESLCISDIFMILHKMSYNLSKVTIYHIVNNLVNSNSVVYDLMKHDNKRITKYFRYNYNKQ